MNACTSNRFPALCADSRSVVAALTLFKQKLEAAVTSGAADSAAEVSTQCLNTMTCTRSEVVSYAAVVLSGSLYATQ
jgi:hypothetical protein